MIIRYSKLLAIAVVIAQTIVPVASGTVARPHTPNEPMVIRSLREVHRAQFIYQATVGSGNFGSFSQLYQAGLIDVVLANYYKYGYAFQWSQVTGGPTWPALFTSGAFPVKYRKTGVRSFYIDQNGDIRGRDKNGNTASVNDPIFDDCTNGSPLENDRCTVYDMRNLHAGQMSFVRTSPGGRFGSLLQLYLAGLIRTDLHDSATRGYVYSYQFTDPGPSSPATYKIFATPATYATTGIRSFYVDETGILRGADKNGAPANETDPPINE
jgi:hypothetical protein